ncbi:hypothetical protein, partial [Adlercreutzia sp. DFI.6.23]|uniref:hypothetical protein n=1 Tax=Adlercreutzia sp. DFI.6.23 TaxID=2963705 RepID=UPI00210D1463
GVTYVPGNSFFPDGKTGRNSMRVNFSFETPESITCAWRAFLRKVPLKIKILGLVVVAILIILIFGVALPLALDYFQISDVYGTFQRRVREVLRFIVVER